MAEARITELHEAIADRAGGTIKCPICGQESWTLYDDSVLTVMGVSLAFWQRAKQDVDASPSVPPSGAADDGSLGSMAAVGGVCDNCGFLRLHAVQSDALL